MLSSVVFVALFTFVATNIDTFTVATAQFAAAPLKRRRRIAGGRWVGMVLLIALAGVLAATLIDIPDRWLGLLAVVPLAFGVRGLLALRTPAGRAGEHKWPITKGAISSVVLTLAAGGLNVAVYLPILDSYSKGDAALAAAIWAALAALLCAGALLAGRDSEGTKGLQRTAALVAPLALLGVSAVVVVQAGTWHWLV
jgi:cadmium resistance protein CadD (predicted permease)